MSADLNELAEAQLALEAVDAELAEALAVKRDAYQVYEEAKAAAKAISDRRDPIAEACWALEKKMRDADEAEFRKFYQEAKLSGVSPLQAAAKMNGGSNG